MGYIFIGLTILFTVYGQLVIKWQMEQAGNLPRDTADKLTFLMYQVVSFRVLSGLAAAFLAALSWMAALTQFELSFAYPFVSLSFVLVLLLSMTLFGEPFVWTKVLGTAIILLGLFVISR
jgi:multidrug transporter EmrE-like cation transporter